MRFWSNTAHVCGTWGSDRVMPRSCRGSSCAESGQRNEANHHSRCVAPSRRRARNAQQMALLGQTRQQSRQRVKCGKPLFFLCSLIPIIWYSNEGKQTRVSTSQALSRTGQIQMLRKSTAKKSLQSKLINLEKTAFLANIPDDQYRDLLNKSAAATAERARLSPSQVLL